ncbi:hypothetical protein Gotur_021024 [Gossypium turneri]
MSKTTIKKGLHATGIMPLAVVDYEVDIEVLTMTFSLHFTLAIDSALACCHELIGSIGISCDEVAHTGDSLALSELSLKFLRPLRRKVELKNTSKSKAIDMLAGVP